MEKEHPYTATCIWTGNQGKGTATYQAYSRDQILRFPGKADIPGSSDPHFRGSQERYNPEELFVSSLSSCHMLWYLHLCSVNGIVVTDYKDEAKGLMIEKEDGSGYFKEVTLYPIVTITEKEKIDKALKLHEEAARYCFIANSCNFPVRHEPQCLVH